MSKIRQIIISIPVGFLSLFCLNCFLLPEKKIELQHLKSPNKEKDALLEINESGSVFLTIKTENKIVKTEYPFYYGENMFGEKGADFVNLYPIRKWISDQVLFFGRNENYKDSKKHNFNQKLIF